jgi:uncharacterized protein YjbI with pentapeptide repeats
MEPGAKSVDRAEALSLLKSGRIDEWNRRRSIGRRLVTFNRRVDLHGASLNEAKLRGADLSRADLSKARLNEVDLSEADLSEADLSGPKLSEANLNGARLRGAKLSRADLSKAKPSGAKLSGAELSEAILIMAVLNQAHLSGADLSGADLSGANLSEAKLFEAKLIEADLSGADLRDADLNDADLDDADLSGADLSGADLNDAHLRGAKLSKAKFFDAHLVRASLTEADLIETELSAANLGSAKLSLARVIRCELTDAYFENADITDCHVQETRGRPIPPSVLRTRGGRTLSREEARSFFNPPATVEVYLSTIISDQEIGLYHFHFGEMKHGEIGTDVHLVGRRTEAEGTVLRFQAPTYEQIYRVLPDLLAPFRLSRAIDWAKTIENLPGNKRGEMLTELARIEGAAPAGFWRFADRLAAGFGNFPKAKVLRFGDGRDWAVRIEVFTKKSLMAKLVATEPRRGAPPPQPRNEFNFLGNVHISLEDLSMTQEIKAGGNLVAATGSGHTVTTGDVVFQQVWNQSADSIDLTSLANDLGRLRAATKQEGTDPEHDIATGNVALAEKAAKEGDGPKALQHLKAAGKWALDAAAKIGVEVAGTALKKAIGVDKP